MATKAKHKFTSADIVQELELVITYTQDGAFASAIDRGREALRMLEILQKNHMERLRQDGYKG